MKHMINILILAAFAVVHWMRRELAAANTYDAAVETHEKTVARTNDVAVTARHLLWTQGAGAGTVKLATAVLPALGTIDNTETGTDVRQTVLLLGKGDTKKMVASGAISAGAFVYQDASGKVSATGVLCVGIALTAAGSDNDIIEVRDQAPGRPAVIGTAVAVAGAALAIPITHRSVNKTTGGVEALTLADGAFLGQRLNINMVGDGGDGTLTPTTASAFSTIVFSEKGQSVELEWTTAGWRIIGMNYVTNKAAITVP